MFLRLEPKGVHDGDTDRFGETWGQGLTAVRRMKNLDPYGDTELMEV